jgi:hypothetical protein
MAIPRTPWFRSKLAFSIAATPALLACLTGCPSTSSSGGGSGGGGQAAKSICTGVQTLLNDIAGLPYETGASTDNALNSISAIVNHDVAQGSESKFQVQRIQNDLQSIPVGGVPDMGTINDMATAAEIISKDC